MTMFFDMVTLINSIVLVALAIQWARETDGCEPRRRRGRSPIQNPDMYPPKVVRPPPSPKPPRPEVPTDANKRIAELESANNLLRLDVVRKDMIIQSLCNPQRRSPDAPSQPVGDQREKDPGEVA